MSQLGKRSRPPSMCRTPSTTALGSLCDIPSIVAPDQDPAALQLQQKEMVSAAAAVADPAAAASGSARRQRQRQAQAQRHATGSAESGGPCFWPPALVSEKVSLQGGGFQGFAAAVAAVEPAQFLKACGLCTRRLGPGKDTYMYRGDMAFCSTECRDLRIALDERLASCSMASGATATTTAGAGSKATRTAA